MTAVGRAAMSAQPPSFSCLLPNGELCITQEPTHTLLCLTVNGELRNAVDPSGCLLNFPMGCACDEGALYVADGFGNQVHKLRLPDFKHEASSPKMGLDYPHGVCIGIGSRHNGLNGARASAEILLSVLIRGGAFTLVPVPRSVPWRCARCERCSL